MKKFVPFFIITFFPPCRHADYAHIKMTNAAAGKYMYTVPAATGQIITTTAVQTGSGRRDIQIDLTKNTVRGILIIQFRNLQTNATNSFTVIKK